MSSLDAELAAELGSMERDGALKSFLQIDSPQGPVIRLADGSEKICLCSNDYLGLADDPEVVAAARDGLDRYGAGTGSVRFICGLFTPHLELEHDLASFLGTEAALTYASCWNANQATLDTLCNKSTWVLSDELNHASIIDGIRLARPEGKAVYAHADVGALRQKLADVPDGRRTIVITDGVFSMEGDLAPLPDILEVCSEYGATLIVDDSHGIGVMGATGQGTAEHFGIGAGEIEITTGTIGKALGGAAGGFVAGSGLLCELLAQRSRVQLFSNGLPPSVACSARAALGRLREEPQLVKRLRDRTGYFRAGLAAAGLEPLEGDSAIVPLLVGETRVAIEVSRRLLAEGILVTGFGYPVVPEGTARIRAQMSAPLSDAQLDQAVAAIARVTVELAAS